MQAVFEMFASLTLDTSKFEQGLKNAESMANGLGSGLATAAKVGAGAVAAATTAVVAFGKSSVDAGMDFDSSMSQVAATMGKTMDEMQSEVGTVELAWGTFSGNLRDYAQEMGANTAFSATQAADALNYMALAGYNTQESMEMLPNVLNLAAAGDMELARASDMVTDTQTAFGLKMEEMPQLIDEMAKAASTGNTNVAQLGDAFLTVGGLAQELNGGFVELSDGTKEPVSGIQELEIALTAMANAGIKGSEAGTHMRNLLMKLSGPTSDGAVLMENMGVKVFDLQGNMRSLNDILSDLGTAMSTMTQEEKINAISELFNARDLSSAEALLNAVGEDWDKIGESILDAEGAAQKMADTQLDNLAGDITLFQSALEGAKIAVSDGLTPTLRDFVQLGTKGLSQVTQAFNSGGLDAAMDAMGQWLADLLDVIIEKIPDLVDAGAQLLTAVVDGIAQNISKIAEAGVEIINSLAAVLIENLPSVLNAGVNAVVEMAKGIGQALPELIPAAVDAVLTLADGLIDNLPNIIEAAVQLMIGFAQGVVNAIPRIVERIPELIQSIITAVINSIPLLIEAGVKLFVALVQNLPQIIATIIAAIPQIVTAIVNGFGQFMGTMMDIGKNLMGAIGDGILSGLSWVGDKINSAGNWIVDKFKGLFGIASPSKVFMGLGDFLMQGLSEGILDGLGAVEDAMDDVEDVLSMDDSDYGDEIVTTTTSIGDSAPSSEGLISASESSDRNVVVVLELNGTEVGRTFLPYINRESKRIGVQLAGGIA